jgi:hypothetical protein
MNLLNICDALVLVHPDFLPPRHIYNKDYFNNLEIATKKMQENNKPIFAYPSYRQDFPESLSHKWQIIPSENYYHFYPETRFYLSKEIGKNIRDLTIAAGGIFAEECVYNAMSTWCNEILTESDHYLSENHKSNKIKKAIIIPEITEKC